MASAGLIGTEIGMVSTRVIFMSRARWKLPRQHPHRMLEAEPQEKAVNRPDDAHEDQPPDAEILPSMIAALLVLRQPRVARRPDDRVNLLRWRCTQRAYPS